ncbi:MAG: phosphatase PAP2 family protein, partial [Sphingobacteriaceae bacterium]
GKNMLPSGVSLQDDEDLYVAQLQKNKISQSVIDQSISVAQQVSAQIINFSKADHYNQLSAKLRYTPKKGDGFWYPTPPAYLDAVEPNWKTIRPMVIDSNSQFKPAPPVKFSKDTASAFFKLAKEVVDVSKKPTPEQLHIAAFWDCNPFAVTTSGHMSIGYKKISPGGHWMNIAALAVKKLNLNFDASIQTVTLESLTLMDVFISCWDEKYRSNRIRPETYINKYIDINWKPFLQTPPFPEYTSGHSVVSNSSAEILTYLLGDHFVYTDDTEIPYGVEPRPFTSFNQAAAEAMISRLWGGIHFRDSIEEGNKEGREVAQNIIEKVKKAGIKPFIK